LPGKGQELPNAASRRQNGKNIGGKCPPPVVYLPARVFCFEIAAILSSFGFGQFCPLLRWQAQKYLHIPVACRLALNKIDSNLEAEFGSS
jgi:hypothetical protein